MRPRAGLAALNAEVTSQAVARWTPDTGPYALASVTILQGFGMGFVWIPAECLRLRHTAGASAHRRHGSVQPRPQRRQRDRRVGEFLQGC